MTGFILHRGTLIEQLDLYDFFMHGDVEALETANGVRKSDVWFILNGKLLAVQKLLSSLMVWM